MWRCPSLAPSTFHSSLRCPLFMPCFLPLCSCIVRLCLFVSNGLSKLTACRGCFVSKTVSRHDLPMPAIQVLLYRMASHPQPSPFAIPIHSLHLLWLLWQSGHFCLGRSQLAQHSLLNLLDLLNQVALLLSGERRIAYISLPIKPSCPSWPTKSPKEQFLSKSLPSLTPSCRCITSAYSKHLSTFPCQTYP